MDGSAVRTASAAPAEKAVVTSRFSSRRLERPAPAGLELVVVRAVLGVAGAGGLALAGYVTYEARDGTATAAFIGASVVLLFLAAFGHMIKSFKYGEVEMLLSQARTAGERGDDEAREVFVDAALSAAGVRGLSKDIEVTSEAYLHRIAVLNALRGAVGSDVRIKYIHTPVRGLALTDDAAIGLHMRRGVKKVDLLRDRLIENGLQAGGRHLDGLLLAVREAVAPSRLETARERLQDTLGVPVRVVGWASDDPPGPLAEALSDLLAEIRAAAV